MNVLGESHGEGWSLFNADSVEFMRDVPTSSVDFTMFSPPYLALYVYTASERDVGNARTDAEFWEHFGRMIPEIIRTIKPGRIVAVDCMNVPAMKERDGYIGIKDFRGDIIRRFIEAGFIFHSEHCMWKDPLIEATRTKALGLMHKQLCKDSAMARAGLPQYLLAFRKPGVNAAPIAHPHGLESFVGQDPPTTGNLAHERWRRYASPVWMDIDFTRTLNAVAAREALDLRHPCPFSLDIVERALELWSNPGETVMDQYAGIGSVGVVAVERGRKFIGIELKQSNYLLAERYIRAAEPKAAGRQVSIFDLMKEGGVNAT